jgi:hypothetical protein
MLPSVPRRLHLYIITLIYPEDDGQFNAKYASAERNVKKESVKSVDERRNFISSWLILNDRLWKKRRTDSSDHIIQSDLDTIYNVTMAQAAAALAAWNNGTG